MDNAGNLFGTANAAFELSHSTDGWKETLLHDFTGQHGDGFGHYAGLILDTAGNLYGETEAGNKYTVWWRLRHCLPTAARFRRRLEGAHSP